MITKTRATRGDVLPFEVLSAVEQLGQRVPCARLAVREVGAGAFEGTFIYGKSYLQRHDPMALDEYHLPLSDKPQKFTKLKGIPGALRDASPDSWGRRVIQAKLDRPEADISEMTYLLQGPDDAAGCRLRGGSQRPVLRRLQ